MKDWIYLFIGSLLRLLTSIKRRRILFLSYYGEQYGCNPKYLSKYIIENGLDWDVVWVYNTNKTIKGAKIVKYLSLKFFYYLSTSKVIVSNYRMPLFFKKKRNQLYVQTWHSSLRLKTIEADAIQTIPQHYIEMAKRDSAQIDILLSGCRYSTEIFRRCFWYDGQILESGTPRCDILVNKPSMLSHNVRNALGISQNEFVVLYAPTFRKNNTLKYYNIDFERLSSIIQKATGRIPKILLRLHPHLKEYSKQVISSYNCNILDATRYDDLQELLLIADCLISDYSGLMFDYLLTARPCLLYVPDLEEYLSSDRKLYFNIDELPFPICRDNDELNEEAEKIVTTHFAEKYSEFNEKVGSFEDGNASRRIMDYLDKLANK